MTPVKLRVRQCFHVIFFLIILCLMLKIADYCLYNDSTYTRLMFHEMYQSKPIDVAFIGSSNVYRHFDPKTWDENLGMYTFNLGTSSQTPDDAYYIMKELFKSQSPEYCIYGINSILFLEMDVYNDPVKNYIIFDYLKPSINKYTYGYTVFQDKSLLNGWIPATRNTSKSLAAIKKVLDIKGSETYQMYQYDIYETSNEEYQGRGFVYSNRQTEAGAVGKVEGYRFCDYKISEKYLFYMKKLKELCDENECKLIFVVPPLPYASMEMQEDYQEILDFYYAVADDIGVALFPFDISKHEYLLMEDNDFYDGAHMSGKGAVRFSRAASELVRKYMDGEEIDRNEYFYSSYEELLDNSPWIFNTWLEKNEDGYTAQASYGDGVTPEYCFQWSDNKGESWHMLQDYSRNNWISSESLPDGCNMLMVWAKPRGVFLEEADYQQCDRMELE